MESFEFFIVMLVMGTTYLGAGLYALFNMHPIVSTIGIGVGLGHLVGAVNCLYEWIKNEG